VSNSVLNYGAVQQQYENIPSPSLMVQ